MKMISDGMRRHLRTTYRVVTFGLMLKGAIGGSLAALALCGVAVPLFGVEPTNLGEGVAATAGAILGVVAAFRA
jgi:hypothetical protein